MGLSWRLRWLRLGRLGRDPPRAISPGDWVLMRWAGYYNQQTAVATSINADTVMRWNQYVYEAQMNANRMHAEKLAADRTQTNQAAAQIRDRLRNNPERSGRLPWRRPNVALDEINDPRVYSKALQGGQVKIPSTTIRNIPFQKASSAITMSIHQLVKGGRPRLCRHRLSPKIERPSRRWDRRSASRSKRTRRREGND